MLARARVLADERAKGRAEQRAGEQTSGVLQSAAWQPPWLFMWRVAHLNASSAMDRSPSLAPGSRRPKRRDVAARRPTVAALSALSANIRSISSGSSVSVGGKQSSISRGSLAPQGRHSFQQGVCDPTPRARVAPRLVPSARTPQPRVAKRLHLGEGARKGPARSPTKSRAALLAPHPFTESSPPSPHRAR